MSPTISSSRMQWLSKAKVCLLVVAALLVFTGIAECRTKGRVRHFRAQATAYSQSGTTADGGHTRRGIVAADPAVLPLGTKIRVKGAGVTGTYVVTDTGRKVDGRHIDIFMPSTTKAKRFGRKVVEVQVVRWGETASS